MPAENITQKDTEIITTLTYEASADSPPSGIIKYVVVKGFQAAVKDLPEIGSCSGHFPGDLPLAKASVTAQDSGAAEVTLTYQASEGAAGEDAEPVYKLTITAGNESILLHENFSSVPETEKLLISALLSGTNAWDKVTLGAENGEPFVAQGSTENGKTMTLAAALKKYVSSAAGKTLLELVKSGVKDYKAFGAEWTETSYARTLGNVLSDQGKICSPDGNPPSASGRNWLASGVEAEKSGTDLWKITRKWTLSDSGAKWNEKIYK